MGDLARWLGEQLDEDERIARGASWTDDANAWHAEPSPFGARGDGQRWFVEDAMDDGVITHVDPKAADDEGVARHIAEWDPARVLREIDAKRDLLRFAKGIHDHHETFTTGVAARLEQTLRLFALAYADRPGYREEWAP